MSEYEKGATVRTKHITVGIKTDAEASVEGRFTGYASVFGNKDSYGDVVVKGAFAESLKSYGENGAGIPCYWSHQMSDPMMNIGQTVKAMEDDHGLFVEVQLDLDNPNAAYTYKLIKEGRVNQMSFAFDIEDYAFAESEELGDYLELRKMRLHEVSVVQVGANQATELLDVKDRLSRLKAGRALSTKNEDQLRQAQSLIEDVLSSIDQSDEKADDTQDSGDEPGSPDQPDVVQDQAKSGGQPDLALANINMIALEGAS